MLIKIVTNLSIIQLIIFNDNKYEYLSCGKFSQQLRLLFKFLNGSPDKTRFGLKTTNTHLQIGEQLYVVDKSGHKMSLKSPWTVV